MISGMLYLWAHQNRQERGTERIQKDVLKMNVNIDSGILKRTASINKTCVFVPLKPSAVSVLNVGTQICEPWKSTTLRMVEAKTVKLGAVIACLPAL